LGKHFPIAADLRARIKPKKSSETGSCVINRVFRRLAPELLSFPMGRSEGAKNAVDIGGGFVVFIEGRVSAAMAAGGQIADLESEIRVLRKGDRL
jgi:hypothetical protein